jgi:hypothetical protein
MDFESNDKREVKKVVILDEKRSRELDRILEETRRDIEAGRYVVESADEHIRRLKAELFGESGETDF